MHRRRLTATHLSLSMEIPSLPGCRASQWQTWAQLPCSSSEQVQSLARQTRLVSSGWARHSIILGSASLMSVTSFPSTARASIFFVQFIQCKHIDSPLKYGMLPFLWSSERCIHIHTPQPHVALYYIIYNLDNLCRPSFNIPDLVNPVFIKIRFVGNKDQGSLIVLEGTL